MLFRPPVLKVKAKIYFASPKIQIYVFLLPASEKGLRKEEHGLTTKCLKTNKQMESFTSSSSEAFFWVNGKFCESMLLFWSLLYFDSFLARLKIRLWAFPLCSNGSDELERWQ